MKKEGNEWLEQWDDVAQVPYMFNGEKWVSFDNQRSVAIKVWIQYYIENCICVKHKELI